MIPVRPHADFAGQDGVVQFAVGIDRYVPLQRAAVAELHGGHHPAADVQPALADAAPAPCAQIGVILAVDEFVFIFPARVPSRLTVISCGESGTFAPFFVGTPMKKLRIASALSQLNAAEPV